MSKIFSGLSPLDINSLQKVLFGVSFVPLLNTAFVVLISIATFFSFIYNSKFFKWLTREGE